MEPNNEEQEEKKLLQTLERLNARMDVLRSKTVKTSWILVGTQILSLVIFVGVGIYCYIQLGHLSDELSQMNQGLEKVLQKF